MQRYVLIAASLLLAACGVERRSYEARDSAAAPRDATRASDCNAQPVTGNGIGALSIGASVDSVRAHCTVLRDTTELGAEGLPVRILTVAIADDTVAAEVVKQRVWRIEILRPSPRTADSLGVGTPLARLLALPGAHGLSGEGAVFAVAPSHCGLSFQLSESGSDTLPPDLTTDALGRLPRSTRVTRVLIVGCETAS